MDPGGIWFYLDPHSKKKKTQYDSDPCPDPSYKNDWVSFNTLVMKHWKKVRLLQILRVSDPVRGLQNKSGSDFQKNGSGSATLLITRLISLDNADWWPGKFNGKPLGDIKTIEQKHGADCITPVGYNKGGPGSRCNKSGAHMKKQTFSVPGLEKITCPKSLSIFYSLL